VFWILPLGSSFWLDETGTAWAIQGSLAQTIARAYHPGQPSVLFSIIAWIIAGTGGLHELTLRLPSLIACLGATLGVYRLASRSTYREEALLACGIFVLNGPVSFAAAEARPYGLALMAVVWAVVMLGRWCGNSRLSCGVGYAACVVLSIALHYLCAVMVVVYAIYISSRNRLPAHFWKVFFAICLVLTPLAAHVEHLWHARVEHSFAPTPTPADLISAVFPIRLIAGFCLSALVVGARSVGQLFRRELLVTPHRLFLMGWHLIPIVSLWAVSVFSDAKLFVSRYYLWSTPALALFVASLLSEIPSTRTRRKMELCILAALCCRSVTWGPAAHGGEDWRGALAAARRIATKNSVLMVRAAFNESRYDSSLGSTVSGNPNLAPLAMYPVDHKVELAPFGLTPPERERLEEVASDVLRRHTTLLFVNRPSGPAVDQWLLGRFSGTKYRIDGVGGFAGLELLLFHP
jgi:hypothetical protein